MRIRFNEGGRGFTFYFNTAVRMFRVYIAGEVFLWMWGYRHYEPLTRTYRPTRFSFEWTRH